jgi:death-on-curing protein
MTLKKPTKNLQLSNIVWIELDDFESLCFRLAQEHLTFNQPIQDFISRSPGVLESCLKTPLQQFNKKDLYESFEDKISILFYLLIKNHPFINGNKRIALTTLLAVLYLNGKWIKKKPRDLYFLAKDVSRSEREDMDQLLRNIREFLKRNIVDR